MTRGDGIERVLRGLGQVEVPPDLEQQVLRRTRGHTAAAGAWRRSVWVFGLAVAAGAAVVGAGVWEVGVRGRHAVPADVKELRVPVSLSPVLAAPRAATTRAPLLRTAKVGSAPPVAGHSVAPLRSGEEAGFPAPEAPLTDQEKLLLRLARRPNQGTIAMFDARIREERATAEQAAFAFFNPQQPAQPGQTEETQNEVIPGKQ